MLQEQVWSNNAIWTIRKKKKIQEKNEQEIVFFGRNISKIGEKSKTLIEIFFLEKSEMKKDEEKWRKMKKKKTKMNKNEAKAVKAAKATKAAAKNEKQQTQ